MDRHACLGHSGFLPSSKTIAKHLLCGGEGLPQELRTKEGWRSQSQTAKAARGTEGTWEERRLGVAFLRMYFRVHFGLFLVLIWCQTFPEEIKNE